MAFTSTDFTTSVERVDFDELRRRTAVPSATLITIVEHGIIEPVGHEPEQWTFGVDAVVVVRRVLRLRHELELDWQGAALADELIEENRRLRIANERLEQRLSRWVDVSSE